MRILLITLCKNEIDILPFVSQYWERIGCDVFVMDNGSTDGSLEYLSKLPYVTVEHFDSDGQNDVIQKTIKEQMYLKLKDQYDIIIISDMDEVFFFNDFKAISEAFVKSPYNILMMPIFSLCESFKPPYSDSLDLKDMTYVSQHLRNQVEVLKDQLKKWICEHYESFPLADVCACGCNSCCDHNAKLNKPNPEFLVYGTPRKNTNLK